MAPARIASRSSRSIARRSTSAAGFSNLPRALADAADGADAAGPHADVGPVAGHAGAVDHRAVFDHEVVRHRPLLPSGPAGPRSSTWPYRTPLERGPRGRDTPWVA